MTNTAGVFVSDPMFHFWPRHDPGYWLSLSLLRFVLRCLHAGHLEYTPLFFAGAKGVPMVEQWPVVKGGAMKLWFVQDEEEKEEEAVYAAAQS